MKQSNNRDNRIFGRLATEKEKTIIVGFLITVMVFMLVRILERNGPQNTNAAIVTQQGIGSQINSKLNISFIELPKVEGRNDVLTRDFFAVADWRDFIKDEEGERGSTEEVSSISGKRGVETIRCVAERLKLETGVLGENPKDFINDKLLSVGQKLFIGDGINTCECVVAAIEGNTVFIRCGEEDVENFGFMPKD